MLILMVAPQPFYQDRGTPIAVRLVLEALSELGHRVDLMTYPLGRDVELPGLRILRSANPLGFSSVPISFSWRKLVLDICMLPRLRALLAGGRYAAVHAVEEAAFPCALLGGRLGVPLVYDMQSSLPEQLEARALFRSRPVRRCLGACETWLVRRAARVACSAGLGEHVRSIDAEADVREWIFPTPEIHVEPEAVERVRRELGLDAAARVVVYTGNFKSYQGLPRLIESLEQVRATRRDVVCILVGAETAADRRLAEGSRAPDEALRVLPRQPRDAMAAYLALADVLVSPRDYGGNLPLKIFDYLRAGKPIIATDTPTHRSVLDDDLALLTPLSASGLAEAIVGVLDDPERAARLARAGRRYAADHLEPTHFRRRVADLYAGLGSVDRSPAEPS